MGTGARDEPNSQLVPAAKTRGRPGSRIAVPRRPPHGRPDSIRFARDPGTQAGRARDRGRDASSRGDTRHLADEMAARLRIRPALFGTLLPSKPVLYGDCGPFARA